MCGVNLSGAERTAADTQLAVEHQRLQQAVVAYGEALIRLGASTPAGGS